jgi:hypothetical protein
MNMPSRELERLAAMGVLEREPPIAAEIEGLVSDAIATLRDSRNASLSDESRFRLAYAGVHAIALAALRCHGYRPRNRQIVFQALAHTLQTPAAIWRMLSQAHAQRNKREYEGSGEIDARLLEDVIAASDDLLARVQQLRRAVE